MSSKPAVVLLLLAMMRPAAAVAQEQPGSGFVPGARILLSDDFAGMPFGTALPNWVMRGGVGRLLNGRLAFEAGSTTRMTPRIASWPAGFTIEMDFQGPALDTDDLRNISWEFNKGDITAWYATLTLYSSSQCSLLVLVADPGENQRVSCEWLRDAPNKFALWLEGGRLRIYLNGKSIIDSNEMTGTAFQQAALVLSSDGLPVSFGSFRIAEATGTTGLADVRSTVGGALPTPGGPTRPGARTIDRDALRQPSLTLTSPQRGDVLVTGMTYPISWQYQWDLGPASIELVAANTRSSLWIAPSLPLDGSGTGRFDWRVFENLHTANDYFIRVTSLSDSTLSAIVGPVSISRPTITLISPRPGAAFAPGEIVPIRWTYTGKSSDRVMLTATLQGGSSPPFQVGLPIGSDGQGEYGYWTPQPTADARVFTVRIESLEDPAAFSEAAISITGGGAGVGGAGVGGNPSPPPAVFLRRAVAIFDTQDENKDKETAVTVTLTTRDTTPGRTAGVDTVASIVDAAGSGVAATEYRPFTTQALGLSVNPNIQPGDCRDLVLWVNTRPGAALQFDRWRFRVRVELDFTDGTRVIRTSDHNEERGGINLPPAQAIYSEVAGPTQLQQLEIVPPTVYYDSLVSELRLYVQTGSDDLRGGMEVDATVTFNSRPSVTFWNINKTQRWPDNSSSRVILPFVQDVTVGDISGVTLTVRQPMTVAVTAGLLADNWHMNSLEVAGMVKGAPVRLMRKAGTPILYRFTRSDPAYTITR